MSKERELLRECYFYIDNKIDASPKALLLLRIDELLAQPEQTEQAPKLYIYKDIFEDYKYLLNAFKNGADANDYSREIQQAKSDIRKACNWLYPLPTDVIDALTQKSFYAGTFDFRVFARELEKQHGIGFTDE